MLPARRGSPLGDILLLGTCLSLALPISPALADPAALPDWGVASKPKPKPDPSPDPSPASSPAPSVTPPAPAPEATAPEADEIEIEADPEPAGPPPQSNRSAKSKPKSKSRSKARKASEAAKTAEVLAQQARAEARRQEARDIARRRGHGEVITGALLTTGGLASFGVMSGGLYLNRISERELDKGAGRPEQDLAPLQDQKRQAETMIAAGAIAGAAGLALGIALLTIGARELKATRGARDLKATRGEPLAARVRIAPTLGGFVLAGRF